MLGRMLSALVRWAGWSPVGKRIRLALADGTIDPTASRICPGAIVSVVPGEHGEDGSESELCAVVRLDQALEHAGRRFEHVLLLPRHAGFGLYTLPVTGIGVHAVPLAGSTATDASTLADAIGIWWLTLARFDRHGR